MCCCCGRGVRRLSCAGCHRFESVCFLRYVLSCWIAALQTERTFSEAGELTTWPSDILWDAFSPHKTIRASLKCTNPSREAPVPIIRECRDLLDFSFRNSYSLARLPYLTPHHHLFTILLMKPLLRAQMNVQAACARPEEKSSSHARPTST